MPDKIQKVEVVKPKVQKVEMAHGDMPRMLPSLSLTSDDLPAIKNWKVGGKYKLTVTVEQTSMSQGDEYDMPMQAGESPKKKPMRARFRIVDIKTDDGTNNPKDSPRQKKIAKLADKAKEY